MLERRAPTRLNREAFMLTMTPTKRVRVRAYVRMRRGRSEQVCTHTRAWPDTQLRLL